MINKFSILALVAILAACGENGTQTGYADTTHKDSSTTPAAPVEAMPPDTSKSLKPDSQAKPAGKGTDQMGTKKPGTGGG